jgi:hypothetical protein
MDEKDKAALAILEEIIDLAAEFGWKAAIQENVDGQVIGMYLGLKQWVETKTGKAGTPKDIH